jgi:hypothetical protein
LRTKPGGRKFEIEWRREQKKKKTKEWKIFHAGSSAFSDMDRWI